MKATHQAPGSLQGRRIVVGLTGGIACYKGAELVRSLGRLEADVHVILTRGAREFLTPLTLQTLSGNPVGTELFDLTQESEIGHIRLADAADVLVVAPATAHVIARLAWGFADDLLTTVALATRAPLVVAPAMNVNMFEHPATQENLERLRERGALIVPSEEGFLACGWEGTGRLAGERAIVESVRRALTPASLAGERVLVTAGPTREAIDPVRYISNRSSGKMGYAVARAAWHHGAEVVLITGPTALEPPPGVECVPVTTAEEMGRAVLEREKDASIVMMTAAIADYKPARPALQKIKKQERRTVLELDRTTDVLGELARRTTPRQLRIGFAAETESPIENARQKLAKKGLHCIVLNDVSESGAGFDVDTNRVTMLDADGGIDEWPLLSKEAVAHRLVERIVALRRSLGARAAKRAERSRTRR